MGQFLPDSMCKVKSCTMEQEGARCYPGWAVEFGRLLNHCHHRRLLRHPSTVALTTVASSVTSSAVLSSAAVATLAISVSITITTVVAIAVAVAVTGPAVFSSVSICSRDFVSCKICNIVFTEVEFVLLLFLFFLLLAFLWINDTGWGTWSWAIKYRYAIGISPSLLPILKLYDNYIGGSPQVPIKQKKQGSKEPRML